MKVQSLAAATGLALALGLTHAALAAGCEGPPTDTRLDVVVEGVPSEVGLLTATVYEDDPSRYLKPSGSLMSARVPPQPPTTRLCLWLPKPGPYAIAVFQDLNRNQHFDHEGLKFEPFGFSRNPHIFLSPPKLEATRIQIRAGQTTIHVRLHTSVPS